MYSCYNQNRNTKKLTQNYAVVFKENNNTEFGFLKRIFIINEVFYGTVQKLDKKRNFLENENMEKKLNEFYFIAFLSNNFLIIKLENILNKCSLINNIHNDEIFINKC